MMHDVRARFLLHGGPGTMQIDKSSHSERRNV